MAAVRFVVAFLASLFSAVVTRATRASRVGPRRARRGTHAGVGAASWRIRLHQWYRRHLQGRRRRWAVVVGVAVLLPVAAPLGLMGPAPSLSSLGGWIRGLLTSPQVQAIPGPRQQSGTAKGAPTKAPASATDAGRGAGRPPGKGKGELAAYTPHRPGGKPQPVPAKEGKVGFDPKTSKRVAKSSTATKDVYANADGSYTAKVSAGRVNYQTAKGGWAPIDTTLVAGKNRRYGQKANDTGLTLAATATDPALVTLSTDAGHALSFGLIGASAARATVKGATATYPAVFPGVDLVESATPTGVKESLVLHSPAAGSSWLFPLRLRGLTPRLAKDGSVELVGAAGKVVYRIPHGYMQDSAVDPKTHRPATSTAVTYTLETLGGSPALRVSADTKWLHNPARKYPVTVDPTVAELSDTSGASGSTFVETGYPDPLDTYPYLFVGGYDGDGYHVGLRSFLKFDGFESTYAGAGLASAALNLYNNYASDCTNSTTFSVAQVTDSWTPEETTWPGPAFGGSVTPPVAIGTWNGVVSGGACTNSDDTGNWRPVALQTNVLQSWINGEKPNHGLAVFAPETGNQYLTFASVASGQNQPYLSLTYTSSLPQVDSQYPPDNYQVSTLAPELHASGHDPVSGPQALQYQFVVYDSAGNEVVRSAWEAAGRWAVPAGKLVWGKTYLWGVVVSDGQSTSSSKPRLHALSTYVPQPLITSGLSQNASGHGTDPARGNYTTSAVDAVVASVGPAPLAVERHFNSLDGRASGAFGAGWSSMFDAHLTEVKDTANVVQTVLVRGVDGREVSFARNPEGWSGPLGRHLVLVSATGGGYTLTDEQKTRYHFIQPVGAGEFALAWILDAQRRTMRFDYTGGKVTKVTSKPSPEATGRYLSLTWSSSSPHVESVSTPSGATWTYKYTGDRLTDVCPPTSATSCTKYTYTDANLYPEAVLAARPVSYYRLGEAAGATSAADSVLRPVSSGTATPSGVSFGQPDSLPGSNALAAGFNGTNSWVELDGTKLDAAYLAVSLRFRTTATNGVLFSYQADPITKGTTSGNYTPALYVGKDGHLVGAFWNCPAIATGKQVNDGKWHDVVLSGTGNAQTLYLDGESQTTNGTIRLPDSHSADHVYIGNGFLGATGTASPFSGSIADVAFFDRPLTDATVTAMHTAATQVTAGLTSVTQPSGKVAAKIDYDPVNARVKKVTDENGGDWVLDAPAPIASSAQYGKVVRESGPSGYWRFAEHEGATSAANEMNGGPRLSYQRAVAGFDLGPFPDATVAAFNASRAMYAEPEADSPLVVDRSEQSISMLFLAGAGGGVLASYHQAPLDNPTAGGDYVPLLYVGTDGKLYGQYGSERVIALGGKPVGGGWHHVVLTVSGSFQTLFLDGEWIGSTGMAPKLEGKVSLGAHSEIGAGIISAPWPGAEGGPHASYFDGMIAEVAVYQKALSWDQVKRQYAALGHADMFLGGQDEQSAVPSIMVKVTDPAGKPLRHFFDVTHDLRPTAVTAASGATTRYQYDTGGFLNKVIDANSNAVTLGHDAHGNVVSHTTCQDASQKKCSTTYYSYDAEDQLEAVRDPRSASKTDATYLTEYKYDANHHLVEVTTPPVAIDDPTTNSITTAKRTTRLRYTTGVESGSDGGSVPAGLLWEVYPPGKAATTYDYNTNGDVTLVKDAADLRTGYDYDPDGQVVKKTLVLLPDTGNPADIVELNTVYERDKAGRVLSMTEPSVTDQGSQKKHTQKTTWEYDVDGLVKSQKVEDTTGGDATRTVSFAYDVHGRVDTSVDPLNKATRFLYDKFGHIEQRIDAVGDPLERVTRYSYDEDQRLTATELRGYTGSDPLRPLEQAKVLTLSSRAYDPAGRLASITDAMGRTTQYQYTDDGLLTKVVRKDVKPSTKTFVEEENRYDAAGNLTSQLTNNGSTLTTFTVDAANRTVVTALDPTLSPTLDPTVLIPVLDPDKMDPERLNRITRYTYTADDQVRTAKLTGTLPTWSKVTAEYNAAGQMISSTLTGSVEPSVQRKTTWLLDTRGLPIRETNPAGRVTDFTYDEAGRLVKRLEPEVDVTTVSNGTASVEKRRPETITSYNTFGEITAVKDPNGHTTNYAYDASGRLFSETLPRYTPPGATEIQAKTEQEYDALGRVLSRTDPLGNKTKYGYDQLDNLTRVTEPEGKLTTIAYDENGEPREVTDPIGAVTAAIYDYLGREIKSTQVVRQPAGEHITEYEYGVNGLLGAVKSPQGARTALEYNAAGELTKITDGAGNSTSYLYDYAGRKAGTDWPDGSAERLGYDNAGNPTTKMDLSTKGTARTAARAAYDLVGNLKSLTDAREHTSTFEYDARGALIQQTEPVNPTTSITTSFGYDAAGNRTRFTDGKGQDWLTTYNAWDLPESQIEPSTPTHSGLSDRTFTTVYDANGRVDQIRKPGAVTITNTYDEADRLIKSTGTGATAATLDRLFEYDGADQLISATSGSGATARTNKFRYDDRGLLLSTSGPSGDSTFAYNADGLMTSRTDAAGTSSYTYDTASRLKTLTDAVTGTTQTYEYNNMSRPTAVWYGTPPDHPERKEMHYDEWGRLSSDGVVLYASATIEDSSYEYDENGNVTYKRSMRRGGGPADTYTYDHANRITSSTRGSATTTYDYDANGNRIKAGATTYTYNGRNQLTSDGTRTYTYTADGTLSQVTGGGATESSTFDAFGQAITQGGSTYTYDALGRSTAVTNTTGTRNLAYTGLDNTLAADGPAKYSHDPDDALIGVTEGSRAVLAITDQHDDVVAQVDSRTFAIVGSKAYDPFGNVIATDGTMTGSLGYQSGWTDPTSGRVNMWSRWYEPGAGRFISRDMIDLDPVPTSISANRYAYLDDNPLAGTDPLGMFSLDDIRGGLEWLGEATIDKAEEGARAAKRAWRTVEDGLETATDAADRGLTKLGEYSRPYVGLAAGILVGLVVGIGCDAVVTAFTAGAGAVAGMIACGALAGAIGGMVEYSVNTAVEGNEFSWDEFGIDAGIGAAGGAVGAGLGIGISKGLSKASGLVRRVLARGGAETVESAAGRGARAAGRKAGSLVDDAADACMHSFAPDTQVVMADGSRKPIGEVKVGDKVLATNPDTGTTEAKPVVALHRNEDTDLTDVTVRVPAPRASTENAAVPGARGAGRAESKDAAQVEDRLNNPEPAKGGAIGRSTSVSGSTADTVAVTLHTTNHHPFWNETTGTWVDAADLKPGDHLHALGSDEAVVEGVRSWTGHADMNDLTVDDTHTYYVVTADTPVLVHNVGKCAPKGKVGKPGSSKTGKRKGPHELDVTITRKNGKIETGHFESGHMTPAEKAVGYPNNTFLTHTEPRALKYFRRLKGGDVMEMRGFLDPCSRCRGRLNEAYRNSLTPGRSGQPPKYATILYHSTEHRPRGDVWSPDKTKRTGWFTKEGKRKILARSGT